MLPALSCGADANPQDRRVLGRCCLLPYSKARRKLARHLGIFARRGEGLQWQKADLAFSFSGKAEFHKQEDVLNCSAHCDATTYFENSRHSQVSLYPAVNRTYERGHIVR